MIRAPGGRTRRQGVDVDTTPRNGAPANIQFPVAVLTKRRQRRAEVTDAVGDDRIGQIVAIAKNMGVAS